MKDAGPNIVIKQGITKNAGLQNIKHAIDRKDKEGED